MYNFSKQHPKPEDQVQGNQSLLIACWTIMMLPLGISAILVAGEYESHVHAIRHNKIVSDIPCSQTVNGEAYVIDLVTFCMIGGIFQISDALISFLAVWGIWAFPSRINTAHLCIDVLIYSLLCTIGLYMYDRQMTIECQFLPIGEMIFAWSIIPFLLIALIGGWHMHSCALCNSFSHCSVYIVFLLCLACCILCAGRWTVDVLGINFSR